MTNYAAKAKQIADRCEAIKWPVREVGKGFRVEPPGAPAFVIHRTPTSETYYKNIVTKLNRLGLARIEKTMQAQKSKAKTEKLATEEKEANRLAQALAKQNLSLLRAKYAGLSFTDDVGWALKAWETMQNPKIMEVTPEMAPMFLERNTDNRPESPRDIHKLEKALETGRWLLTHQAAAFNTKGVLQDGQTRFRAIANTGITAPMWIHVGMPVDNFTVIDGGRKRNANSALHQAGFRGNLAQRTAFANLVLAHQDGTVVNIRRTTFDPDQILALWLSDPDTFDSAFSQGVRIAKAGSKTSRGSLFVFSAMGAAIYLIKKANGPQHHQKIDQFFEGIETGYDLHKGDARAALRNYMLENRKIKGFDNRAQMMLIVSAWNKVLEGEYTKAMRWATNQTFPRITTLR